MQLEDIDEKEVENKIYESLLHPKHEWRSIEGIIKQTNLSPEKVKNGLLRLMKKKEARRSYVADIKGNNLYGLVSRVDRSLQR
ncbi:MAG: hypothetical protein NT166_25920 [Candidatus Aminicenantes bacterium]|nr:hypothetical protein [Candidatus Aminicenantes bacterium]